ncbi:MAG: DUF1565 domain-containing protein [Atribacterota bacterium]|jgi:parallel beta-helix repeat protein|nr:DUF1565 domain-containing protein [Atribacterota bacterium]MDD4895426.1 DUF1565 domain-containing protein [Atribacterota bacterium]MDD5636826.1 DUF1565 domain-containing protein [Atribacterota bacterium]
MFTKRIPAIVFILFLAIVFLIGGCTAPPPTITYTITATAGENGQINPEGEVQIVEGKDKTFTIIPDEGYLLDVLLVDGISIEPIPLTPIFTYTFKEVIQNHTIQASFVLAKKIYNIDTVVGYDTIQEAIDAALDEETIVVSPGTYYENIVFDDRDITVRSNEIPDGPGMIIDLTKTIIDGGEVNSVVVFTGGDTSTLKGFTIQNGASFYGGGIYIDHSNPTIEDNTIKDNWVTDHGGGIYVYYGEPNIIGNTIINNSAGLTGGGIDLYYSFAYIIDNDIYSNVAGFGGGICVGKHSELLPNAARPDGWGTGTDVQNIPAGEPLNPAESEMYTIAGNTFRGNEHGSPSDYTEGAHVFFD